MPEMGRFTEKYLEAELKSFSDRYELTQPAWFIARNTTNLNAEFNYLAPKEPYQVFLIRAWVLQEPGREACGLPGHALDGPGRPVYHIAQAHRDHPGPAFAPVVARGPCDTIRQEPSARDACRSSCGSMAEGTCPHCQARRGPRNRAGLHYTSIQPFVPLSASPRRRKSRKHVTVASRFFQETVTGELG